MVRRIKDYAVLIGRKNHFNRPYEVNQAKSDNRPLGGIIESILSRLTVCGSTGASRLEHNDPDQDVWDF